MLVAKARPTIRHGTICRADPHYQPEQVLHYAPAFVVVDDPTGDYQAGASFSYLDVSFGLRYLAFPDGMVLADRDGQRYIVRGNKLCGDQCDLVLVAKKAYLKRLINPG